MLNIKKFLVTVLLLLIPTYTVSGDNSIIKDHYTFQYNAFPSTSLPAQMTRQYQFKRSQNMALVNITVIDNNSDIRYKGIKAKVKGVMQNLMGQQKKLKFKEIFEDKTYYYIAEVPTEHNDVVHMKITAQPNDSEKSYDFKFVKQF